MEIVKFKKIKNNKYEIIFDNDSKIELYDDVIVKYNLLVNKKNNKKFFDEVISYNDSLNAYYLAIKYLNSRLRSEKEVIKYLEKKEVSNNVIKLTIDRLKKDNYLNRDLYIKSYINDIYRFKMDGPLKIKMNLINLGFKEEEIDKYLGLDFSDKIKKIIDKKSKVNNKLSLYMFKNKISNYLINLGYSREMFIDYLDNLNIDNSEIIKKDYELLYKKYKNKYEKSKLLYFIKDKLYKKGYNIDEINEVISDELL